MDLTKTYLNNLIDGVDFSIAEHEFIYDEEGKAINYKYLYANKAFCDGLDVKKEALIGKTVLDIFPNTEAYWIEKYYQIYNSRKPESFVNYAQEFERYFAVYAYKSGENRFVTSFKDITDFVEDNTISERKDIVDLAFRDAEGTAYFEFDLRKKTFEHSDNLPDIIGQENITFEKYERSFLKIVHPSDLRNVKALLKKFFNRETEEIASQIRIYNLAKKDYVWINFFAYVEQRIRNVPIKIKGLIKNIDIQKKQELELITMERLFKETRKVANIVTFYYSFPRRAFNRSKELEEFIGVKDFYQIEQFRKILHPDDLENYDYSTREIRNNPEGMISNYRIIKNGEIRHIQSSIFGEMSNTGEIIGVFGILKDITELEKSKEEVSFLANHDLLTGLYNRNNFEQRVRNNRNGANLLVFICDVDGLKLINDAFGHIEGDELLINLATILKEAAPEDEVYRIGGDEFVILKSNASEKDALALETDIKEGIRKFRLYGVGFGVSIGYSVSNDQNGFEDTFRTAENLMYHRKLTERKSRKSNALSTIMETMHEKTEETKEHCDRVADLAQKLLSSIGHKRQYELEEIKLIADVHDIGKISISDKIINKPAKLDEEEYLKMKYHSESGYKILSNIIENEEIAIAVLYHHERYDGRGYPHGLRGEEIPLYSRVISICDAYDAMTSDRPYRKALSKKATIKEIKKLSGIQFDPDLVDKFLKIV